MVKKPIFAPRKSYNMAKKKDQEEEVIVDVKEIYTKTELFVDRNRKMLTGILVGIVAVIAIGAAYYYLVVKPKEQNASAEAWKAEQYFEIDSLDLALYGDGLYAGLEDIANDHSGTKAASRANYQMGIVERDRGNFEDAIAYFEKVDLSDEVVSFLAATAIGDCEVELGNYAEAAKKFEKAVSKAKGTNAEDFTAPIAHYKAGVAYMEMEDNAKAIKHFDAIVENYPESQIHGRAERFVAYLGEK